jgi:hypothetical protein
MKKILLFFISCLFFTNVLKSELLDWELAINNADWSVRQYSASVVYDNKMWIFGGLSDLDLKNDVWYSFNGIDWNIVTGNANWSGRWGLTALVYDDKMWVIGGSKFSSDYQSDVWYSEDGVDWILATGNAGFGRRAFHTSVVYDDKMWVIAGQSYQGVSSDLRNDAWYSEDGVDWIPATQNAEFIKRVWLKSTVYKDLMWISCGTSPGASPSTYLNDVWYSSNGVDWSLATNNALSLGRDAHSFFVIDDKIWIAGGYDGDVIPGDLNDVWYSEDGVDWELDTQNALWEARQAFELLVYNNKIFLFAGVKEATVECNDVWFSSIIFPLNIIDYWSSIWSGRIYEALGNTYMAIKKYNYSIKRTPSTITANEQQNIFYRAGLMLIKTFKSLTNYATNVKTISRISNVSIKATAEANFVATMTPVYTLLPEADTHLTRGLNVTKATKDTIKINQNRSYINYVATYVVSH